MIFRFFRTIHRSVVDPSLAAELPALPVRRIVGFVLALMLVAAAAASIAHALRLSDADEGLPALLPRLFPGMALREGTLVATQPMPWTPNPFDVGDLVTLMADTPPQARAFPDSFLVVDTRETATIEEGSLVQILLTADKALLNMGRRLVVPVSYARLIPGDGSIVFEREALARTMRKGRGALVADLFLMHFLTTASGLLSTLLFLSLAAYIFTVRTSRLPFRFCLRLASFAIVPVVLLKVAGAAGGVRSEWLWHLSVLGSTVVLFRSIHWLNTRQRQPSGNP